MCSESRGVGGLLVSWIYQINIPMCFNPETTAEASVTSRRQGNGEMGEIKR